MASRIDQLLQAFENVLNEPWGSTLSGQERIWFLVFDPAEHRKSTFDWTTLKRRQLNRAKNGR
jgi:hypothetical protein